jgi:hypothetical protein
MLAGMRAIERYREQAERARRWAASIPDPTVRRELETVARDYEHMAQTAEAVDAEQQDDPPSLFRRERDWAGRAPLRCSPGHLSAPHHCRA